MADANILANFGVQQALGVALQLEDPQAKTASCEIRDQSVEKTRSEWADLVKTKYPSLSTEPSNFGSSRWWTAAKKTIKTGVDLEEITPTPQQAAKVETIVETSQRVVPQTPVLEPKEEPVAQEQPSLPKARLSEAIIAPMREAVQLAGGPAQGIFSRIWGQFKNVWSGGAKTVAKESGEAVVSTGAKTGGKIITRFAARLGLNLAPGVGTVAFVLLTIKDFLGGIKNKILPEAESKGKIGLSKLWGSLGTVGILGGAAIGATVGAAFLGIGAIPGAILGGLVGWVFGSGGGFVLGGITDFVGSIGGALTGQGGQPSKKAGLVALGVSVPFWGGILLPAIFSMMSWQQINQAFLAPPVEEVESQGPDPVVAVQKSVNEISLANDSGKDLVYKAVIAAGESDVKVSITDQITVNEKVVASPTLVDASITKNSAKEIDLPAFSVKNYNDSTIVDTVTVTATTNDGRTETRKASAVTVIGTAPNDQPFGFPTSGQIYSLDTQFWKASGQHRGTFFNASGGRYWEPGGMDILDSKGAVPVYSTVKGTVIYSNFDLGDPKTAGKCTNISTVPVGSIFSDCAVGGAVIIQSGKYTVSFLHLNNNLAVATGSQVDRGALLGQTYGGENGGIPTVNGWHLHYQILRSGVPYYFSQAPLGKCRQGAVLPYLPKFGDAVAATTKCD